MEAVHDRRNQSHPPVALPNWSAPEWRFVRHDRDQNRHDVRGYYVERFWMPILGPTSIAILRWFAEPLRVDGEITIPTDALPRLFGLNVVVSKHSSFGRTIQRLIHYRLAEVKGPATVALKTYMPPLLPSAVKSLHPYLVAEHGKLRKK